MSRFLFALAILALLPACSRDGTGPDARVEISVLAGDGQFGLAGADLADPLQVVVVNAGSDEPAEDVAVSWSVRTGNGTVTPVTTSTDARGIASANVRLGSQLGEHRIEATATRQEGSSATFSAQAVLRPEIHEITPTAAVAGETVVINGANFNPRAENNAVRFAGVRGQVITATATRLEVRLPACVPSRTVMVDVLVGSVASLPAPLTATAVPGSVLALEPGEARVITDPADLACLRLPSGIPFASYALIAQNAIPVYTASLPFELTVFAGAAPAAAAPPLAVAPTLPAADAFEFRLRQRERAWVAAAAELRAATAEAAAQTLSPELGDRRTFNVLDSDDNSLSVTAEVKAVSSRAIIYQDITAPANGFNALDFTRFGELFDDPIYGTAASVFGQPSDVDGNGKVIVLLTPRVNALTERGESSFIAGYFYGCDLVEKSRCGDSNRGEIFYSLVPDPQGMFGDPRAVSFVFGAVLPVLAHELQHMINFSQRDRSLDALWLSEGLAHTAEEVVGDVFAARGDAVTARDFRRPNYTRAARFLSALPDISLIAEETPGSLELRGGSWLLLRYLRAHYGGDALLGKLTRTSLSGTQNVAAQTGQSWSRLLADFGVALYSGLIILPGERPRDPLHTFGTFDVRAAFLNQYGSYPLMSRVFNFAGDGLAHELPPSATSIFLLIAPNSVSYPTTHLVFTGTRGGPFATPGVPQLTVFRRR